MNHANLSFDFSTALQFVYFASLRTEDIIEDIEE